MPHTAAMSLSKAAHQYVEADSCAASEKIIINYTGTVRLQFLACL